MRRLPTSPRPTARSGPDVVVVGSGFGGALAARALVDAGARVLLLERGGWVRRGPHNRSLSIGWKDRNAYSMATPYRVEGESSKREGAFHCVGGASVFYGGVALRLREQDFGPTPGVSGDLAWPLDYGDLAPWYAEVEAALGVVGEPGDDPTAPPRRHDLPDPGWPLSPTSRSLAQAARRLGHRPFRLPLALNHRPVNGRGRCTRCGVCDGFACAIGAKNDLASTVLPGLVERGMEIRPDTVVTHLEWDGPRIEAAVALDRTTRRRHRFQADAFVVAAGALATPHLLLSSGLERASPCGDHVGRHLMRHCNGVVVAAAPSPLGHAGHFQKEIGIHDLYHGDSGHPELAGRIGAIQQLRATRIALAMAPLPSGLKAALGPSVERLVAFMVMAEDQPDPENRLTLDARERDVYDRPLARIHHRHSVRDVRARAALADRATRILREAGAAFTFTVPVRTFSHAMGTVRMGTDAERFPVTPEGRFRGIDNLWICDASVFPKAGAVNPSLTIAANALRIGAGIGAGIGTSRVRESRPRRRPAPRAGSPA